MPSAQIVRIPLQVTKRSHRTLDQRIYVRFPALAGALAVLVLRLPVRSRLRRALVARNARSGIEAFNRRDPAAVVIGWDRSFEYRPERAWVEAGLVEPSYRGLEGYSRYLATVDEVWGGENVLEAVALIDLGDRFLILAKAPMRAQASGVELTEEFGLVITLRNGLAVTLQEHYDHARAREAVGLSSARSSPA